MSGQIEDLIADFEDKFNNQFNGPASQAKEQPQKLQNSDKHHQNNPQVEAQSTSSKIKQTNQEVRIIKHYDVDQNIALQESQKNSDHPNPNKQEDFDDQKNQENRYRDLSNKLQTALKKISSSKKVMHSQTQSSDLLLRFEEYERKKEKDLAIQRNIEEEKKYHGIRSKPEINKKSKQIISEIKQKPLHQRYQKLIDDKKKKHQQNEQIKRLKEQSQYEKFLQQFSAHTKVSENTRDMQKFYEDMTLWKEKVQKQRKHKKQQQMSKQMEAYTFKPNINKTSEKLLQSKKRIPIHERQVQKPKTTDPQLTFQPNLKKRKLK